MTYDPFGRQATQTERCGTAGELTTTTTRYFTSAADSAFGKVATRTRAPTDVASSAYSDSLGRGSFSRGRTFNGSFSESFTLYDLWGRTIQQSTPRASGSSDPTYITATTYDEADRVRTIARDLGSIDGTGVPKRAIQTLSYRGLTVRTEHNVDGEDTAHLHQQAQEETKGVLGKVESVVALDGVGGTITYSYDPDGNLRDTFDGQQGVHIEYDGRGNRTLVRDPDLGEWKYSSDGFGDLLTQRDANGQELDMTYDKLGRMTSRTNANTGQDTRWVYDQGSGGVGKLSAMVSEVDDHFNGTCAAPYDLPSDEKRAVRTFTYTALGELHETADCIDGDTFLTTHAYDGFGRESVVTYPQAGTSRVAARYNYTSLGFLHFIDDPSDNSLYWAATARDVSGQVTSEYLRNGVETTSTRNQATGWLMGSQSVAQADGDTLIQSWSYRFDEVGNLRSRLRDDAVNGSTAIEAFTYDPLNRLEGSAVSVGTDNYTETYDFDVLGNLKRKGDKNYLYGAAGGCTTGGPHAVCTVAGGAQYQYDANGNMLSGGDRTVSYNVANKVVHIAGGGNTVQFMYGADGHRVVQEANGAGSVARTVYVGLGETGKSMYERTIKDGAVEHTHFLYAVGAHYGNAFALKIVRSDGSPASLSFNHFDHLGSVTAVSDESGHVVSAAWGGGAATTAGYDPWGARRSPDGRPAADPESFQLLPGHREFTGHETIPGVGLVNMNGRVYDPSIGRFLTPDPHVQFVADLQSYNRYSYVLNNPLRYTDPTGYSASGFLHNLAVGAVMTAACAAAGGGCIVLTYAYVSYNTYTMAQAGATSENIVAMDAIGIAAGFVGGVGGDVIVAEYGGGFAAQVAGGAVGGMMSAEITAAVSGRSLGGEGLLGAGIAGAVAAGVVAGLRGTNPVSQASQAEAKGEGGGRDSVTDVETREHAGGEANRTSSRFAGYEEAYGSDPVLRAKAVAGAYGLDLPSGWDVTYDEDLKTVADTDVVNKRIDLGPRAFRSQGWLASTIGHELVHVDQYALNNLVEDASSVANNINEIEAYDWELANARRFSLTSQEVMSIQGVRGAYIIGADPYYITQSLKGNYLVQPWDRP